MADKTLTIKILSPEGALYDGTAEAVFVPGALCPFEVLPDHAPIISTLDEGSIRWRKDGKEESVDVKGGVVRLENNVMKICVQQ